MGLVQFMNNWRALQSVELLGQVFSSTLFGGFFLVWLLNRVDKIKRGTFHASAFCSIRRFHETTKDLKEGRTSTWFIGIEMDKTKKELCCSVVSQSQGIQRHGFAGPQGWNLFCLGCSLHKPTFNCAARGAGRAGAVWPVFSLVLLFMFKSLSGR